MTATAARKNFFKLLNTAKRPGMAVTITHRGLPEVVVMSFDEFEGWMETLEISSDQNLVKDIREALKEKKTIPLEELEKSLNIRRPPQKNGHKATRNTTHKRSTKSSRQH